MFSLWIIVIVCGVTACPHPTTTPSIHPTTTPHPHSSTTPNTTTINMTTKPPIYHKSPKRCPTKAALIADFISKSKYHFKALQYDHQGYYKALKWNLDMAFKSLEGQFGNLIADVQHDVKDQFTNIQKENDALKTQIIALKSQLTQNMSAVKDEVTEVKKQITDSLKTQTDHVTALDKDECATNNTGCAHICTDKLFGTNNYVCSCYPGYQLMANGHNCTYICNPSEFSEKGGWFSSPNHPSKYLDNTDCTFFIHSPPNTRIRVVYTAFHTESCSTDYVELRSRSNTLLDKKCNKLTVPTPPVTTTDNYLKVHFHSDGSQTYPGYKATYCDYWISRKVMIEGNG